MSESKIIVGLVLICTLAFFLLLIKDTVVYHASQDRQISKFQPPRSSKDIAQSKLFHLIRLQNATIHELERKLAKLTEDSIVSNTSDAILRSEHESPTTSMHRSFVPQLEAEIDCEQRYGLDLVEAWRKKKEVWCASTTSSLTCYPYHQAHKKLDGRGPDLFCEATNFFIDFSKVLLYNLFYFRLLHDLCAMYRYQEVIHQQNHHWVNNTCTSSVALC
jgi:hypothetical protein